jgi:DNA replication protein DnaC
VGSFYELATARFVAQREDVVFLGPPGTGKSHVAQAIGVRRFSRGIAWSTGRPIA